MHGAGNDFVVIDWRDRDSRIDASLARRMADRRRGIGCDQLISIEWSDEAECRFRYGIWNTDGSEAGQCGNGLRCVIAWLHRAQLIGSERVMLQSPSGRVEGQMLGNGLVRAGMGRPRFQPRDIPLLATAEAALYTLPLAIGSVQVAAVSMGNPHAVLRVDDVEKADVQQLGAAIESHPLFPDRCNVGFMQWLSPQHLRLRVYERGVGETLACGSGACAAAVIAMQSAAVERSVRVSLPGGDLQIEWPDPNDQVWMTGPTQFVFEGEWHDD